MTHLLLTTCILAGGSARAWETDPLYGRTAPLADATAAANALADTMIDAAIARTNEELACSADFVTTRRALARHIYRLTSEREQVKERGPVRGQGFGAYAAWLETSDVVDRRSPPVDGSLFHEVPFGVAPILATIGTCSVVHLAGYDVGTDKPDHFFYNGYWYADLAVRRGEEAALRWGTRTERSYYGLATSATFSFADLAANERGGVFYGGLLQPGSIVELVEGCAVRTRPFDWAEYVDWRWDEAYNPNVYTRKLQRWVDAQLDARTEEICAGMAPVLPEIREHLPMAFDEDRDYYTPRAPRRTDPYRLPARCEDAPPSAVTSEGQPVE